MENCKVLVLFSIIAAVILFCFTFTKTVVYFIPTTAYFGLGLLNILPLSWWLSLALSLMALLFTTFYIDDERLFLLATFTYLVVFWNVGALIEPNARITDTYRHGAVAYHILKKENWDVAGAYRRYELQYLQWPGAFVHFVLVALLTGLDENGLLLLLKFFPLLSSTIFMLMVFLMFKHFLGVRYAKVATMITMSLNVYLQFHFSPQAYALMLFPLAITSLTHDEKKYKVLWIISFITVLFVHPITSLILILTVGSLYFGKHIFPVRVDSKSGNALVFASTSYLAYMIHLALLQFRELLISLESTLLNVFLGSLRELRPTVARVGFIVASQIRLFIFIATLTISSCLIIATFRRAKKSSQYALSLLLAGLTLSVLDVFIYSGMFLDRGIAFYYIGFALLVPSVLLLKSFKGRHMRLSVKAVLIIVLALSFVNSITLYYQEGCNVMSNGYIAGWRFVYTNLGEGLSVTGADFHHVLMAGEDTYKHIRSAPILEEDANVLIFNSVNENYMLLIEKMDSYISYISIKNSSLSNSRYLKTYDNGDFAIMTKNIF